MSSDCFLCGFPFTCNELLFPSLAIISGVQAAVSNNATQQRNDGGSDEEGVKENRTARLQIDSAVFQFPRSVMAWPVKLSLEI